MRAESSNEMYGRVWSEREYIIVLNEYLKRHERAPCKTQEYVLQVSGLLGRSPGAVAMRMANFANLDPGRKGGIKGLNHVSPQCRAIWDAWADDVEGLRKCAESQSRDLRTMGMPSLFDPAPVRVPKAFGRYELLDHIADGGFGSVYACLNIEDDEEYALKIVPAQKILDADALSIFRREIRTMKEVSHRHIMRVYEDNLDSERDFPAFIMEMADCTLAEHLNVLGLGARADADVRPAPALKEGTEILLQIFTAVEALHTCSRPLIHRDINPNNILRMKDGRWVLADFGLAKFVRCVPVSVTYQTEKRQGGGTPDFTSPEQFRDFRETTIQSDVYSLGALIWCMFTNVWGALQRDRLGLPEPLADIVVKATEYAPKGRFRDVAELRSAFSRATEAITCR